MNDGVKGLDLAKKTLHDVLFFGMVGDEWLEEIWKFNFQSWLDNQVDEAVLNATVP